VLLLIFFLRKRYLVLLLLRVRVRFRYSDLVDPAVPVKGWAQGLRGGAGGATVTVGKNAARALLGLGLSCFRHATTLGLGSPVDEGSAWLWAGACAEALGDLKAAAAHYTSALQVLGQPRSMFMGPRTARNG